MSTNRRFPPFLLHAIAAIFAIVAVIVFSGEKAAPLQANLLGNSYLVSDIAIEHTSPLALSFEMSRRGGNALILIAHEGDETIFMSLPDSWKRLEVHGVPLASIVSDEPTFGFTRWHFPASAQVSFYAPLAPDELLLHNPSGVPLQISITQVNLDEETVQKDVVLVQDSPAQLL